MQETEDYMSYAVPLSFHESTFIHSRIRDKSLYPLLVTVESVCSYSHLCFLFYYKRFQAAAPRRVLQILSAVSHQTTALCAPVSVYYSFSKHFSYFLCGYYSNIFQGICQSKIQQHLRIQNLAAFTHYSDNCIQDWRYAVFL